MAELLDAIDELLIEMRLDPRACVEYAQEIEAVTDALTGVRYGNEDLRR